MFDKKIVCTYLYTITKYGYPPPAENTINYINEMKNLGFSSIELEGIREKHLLEIYDLRFKIKSKLKKDELNLPYFCAVLPGLTSLDFEEREKHLQLFEKGCEIAGIFGAKGILDNAPFPPFQFPKDIPVVRHYEEDVLNAAYFPENISWKKFWNQMVSTYSIACDIAAKYNLTYQMHPAVGVLSSNTDGFLYFYDAVGKDNLRFNFDTANLFVQKENLSLALRRLSDYIDYIHLSDNKGEKVEHLIPGDGNIRWDIFFETLHKINFKGYIGIDVGGDESNVQKIDEAYLKTAQWIEESYKV